MKNVSKIFSSLLVLLLTVFCFVSCSRDNDSSTDASTGGSGVAKEMVGTYTGVSTVIPTTGTPLRDVPTTLKVEAVGDNTIKITIVNADQFPKELAVITTDVKGVGDEIWAKEPLVTNILYYKGSKSLTYQRTSRPMISFQGKKQ